MLKELRVRDYAVIEDLRLELGPGLNVLTGETGAGKSILVGALSLLLGERASAEVVREGKTKAVVEGVFDVTGIPLIEAACREAGIDVEDGWLILRREVQREGRNRAWVNGSAATAGLIGGLGSALVDLHGQHEHQALLKPRSQQEILDAFAAATDLAVQVAEAHRDISVLLGEIDERRRRAEEVRERADDLLFKAEEIEAADLDPAEEGRLDADIRRLEHSEDLLSLSASLHDGVYAAQDSLVECLGGLRRRLDELVRIDRHTAPLVELYETALATLQELGLRLGDYGHSVEHDPARLASLRVRLDAIYRLRSRYGRTIEEVIAAGRAARAELESLESSEFEIARLEGVARARRDRFEEVAASLTERRREASLRLEEEVNRLLPDLGMPAGVFRVAIRVLEPPDARGAERVEFLVSPNPGFEPAPLSRVASGGELSRIMLALKTVLARVDAVPCLVFDEIDAGIGGRVAGQVAERLASVATSHQVFAVTHLAQIASRADTHLHVEKVEVSGRAAARVRSLAGEDRVAEVARMLGGDASSTVSRQHAQEMLAEHGAA